MSLGIRPASAPSTLMIRTADRHGWVEVRSYPDGSVSVQINGQTARLSRHAVDAITSLIEGNTR